MDDQAIADYVEAALTAQGLRLSEQQLLEVIMYFSRTAEFARLLEEFSVVQGAGGEK